ncbi:Protein MON2 [Portunus trituberculatus]|uniref:Protein MON2 n=1 Tax=Portunus trituberculatus TaxID=210409 RepID=A0A5B7EH94_PORTR|nr:Protein MON2 [Portunus trituberculatus]
MNRAFPPSIFLEASDCLFPATSRIQHKFLHCSIHFIAPFLSPSLSSHSHSVSFLSLSLHYPLPLTLTLTTLANIGLTKAVPQCLYCLRVHAKLIPITEGSGASRAMVPQLFSLLLQFSSYSCQAPSYGNVLTRPHTSKGSTDWVTMNFVPFAERSMSMVVSLYQKTSNWQEVIEASVLKNIIQATITPLRLKYQCPAQTTWKLVITTLLTVLQEGLQLAREHPTHFKDMWPVLGTALDSFLFSNSPPPANQSSEDAERDEGIDCQVVELIREEILPYASSTPSDFIVSIMVLLNKGSIESASGVDSDCEGFKLREEFAKTCFETLLQFSLLTPSDLDPELDNTDKGSSRKSLETSNGFTAQDSTSSLAQSDSTQVTTKLAVTSLLHRFREVLVKYVEDEKLSGKCPLPRHRIAEISFVLKAIATLLSSLKKAPIEKGKFSSGIVIHYKS